MTAAAHVPEPAPTAEPAPRAVRRPGPAWLVYDPPRRARRRVLGSVDRLALAGICSVAAAWVHQHHDPGALCPLRRLTGIPCPLCGSTTVFMEAGAGHWSAALAANPFTVLAFLAFLGAPLARIDPASSWARMPALRRNVLLGVLLGLCWLWQLHRFGFLLGGTRF
ncbi:MAG TPA: DUF2752 domain-containing protein [Actinospica sp.]|nr:DUF2752 domain-containing protein [Actinospica sp.]